MPLKTKPSVNSDDFVKMTREPVSVIYKYIISLLKDAVAKLPDTEYGSQIGRADKYAAAGLLAKVYLHAASSMQLLQPKHDDLPKKVERREKRATAETLYRVRHTERM